MITVAMPVHQARIDSGYYLQAIESIKSQSIHENLHVDVKAAIALDDKKEGAAVTRQRALDLVDTPYVAFLDSDDYFYWAHLETQYRLLIENNADYAYSWFDGNNPFPMHRGRQMDINNPHHTTMTVMVKTELAKEARFVRNGNPNFGNEDYMFLLKCIELGAKFIGTEKITWHYRVHAGNTSGLPNKGDAK